MSFLSKKHFSDGYYIMKTKKEVHRMKVTRKLGICIILVGVMLISVVPTTSKQQSWKKRRKTQ